MFDGRRGGFLQIAGVCTRIAREGRSYLAAIRGHGSVCSSADRCRKLELGTSMRVLDLTAEIESIGVIGTFHAIDIRDFCAFRTKEGSIRSRPSLLKAIQE